MVFQDYALYPQMTVFDNLAFGLRRRKAPKDEIDARVRRRGRRRSSSSALLERKPRQLSGGQQQRVALGRALVRDPQVFLMDEPLSNLDAKLRMQTRGEIKRLQQEVGTTTVYVTHDQVEAMTMGDRIAVMNDGGSSRSARPRSSTSGPPTASWPASSARPAMSFVAGRAGSGSTPAGRGRRRAPGARAAVARRPGRPVRGRGRVRRGARARDVPRRRRRRGSWSSSRAARRAGRATRCATASCATGLRFFDAETGRKRA